MTDSQYVAIERRIEGFIAGLGVVLTAGAAIGWGSRAAEGAAAGAALCWLNFRWLRQGATAVMRLGLAQTGAAAVKVPKIIQAKFFGRIALLGLALYVILVWFRWPAVALLCGLAAVLPAILLELAYELMHGHHRWTA